MVARLRHGGTALVLGGGGHLGAHEVGMLRALYEHGVVPDLIVGTSVGAINGAVMAAAWEQASLDRLADVWVRLNRTGVFQGSLLSQISTLARSGTHLHSNEALRRHLAQALPVDRIEALSIPFQCVAASIEGACERWFAEGPLVEAILASAAVPGVLPPVRINGEHFLDGGIVNSIPVGRAAELGASTIFVLHVGRIERALRPPRWPWEVGLVAFEIARRHRFTTDMAAMPEQVAVHVLPTGAPEPLRFNDLSQLRYRNFRDAGASIDRAYDASRKYLADAGVAGSGGGG
ncbi:MAG: patatin-like phospholipase family protein [Mycobacteriales bacterium]